MVKHTQIFRRLLPTNCLSLLNHFMGLALKGLNHDRDVPKCYVMRKKTQNKKQKTITKTKNTITWILAVIPTSHNKINKKQLKSKNYTVQTVSNLLRIR